MTTQTEDRAYLGRQLLQLHSAGYTFKKLATQFHMTENAAKGLIRTARLKQDRHLDVVHLGEPLDLRGDFIIVGDVHIPCTDWDFASLVGRVLAEQMKYRRPYHQPSDLTDSCIAHLPTAEGVTNPARVAHSGGASHF